MARSANRRFQGGAFFGNRRADVILWAVLLAAVVTGTLLLRLGDRSSEKLPLSFLSGNPARGATLLGVGADVPGYRAHIASASLE